MEGGRHVSVLLNETVAALAHEGLDRGRETLFLDGTLGMGGHAEGVLEAAGPSARLLGLDKDAEARKLAAQRLARFGNRARIVAAGFEDMAGPAREFLGSAPGFDGILMDLGVSSMQLDTPERGFSFRFDAPLDMRLDPSSGEPASEWIKRQDEASLKAVLREFGEEPRAGALARSILRVKPETTAQLVEAVCAVWGKPRHGQTHPATRTFQAIRIAVNGELEALDRALPQALGLLRPGGRLAVISFHSLEDRRAKEFIAREAKGCICPPGLPICGCGHKANVRKVTGKAVVASDDEAARNPRARSARLRVAERLAL